MSKSEIVKFHQDILKVLPENRVITDYSKRFAYSVDASFYRLVPHHVLLVDSETELQQIIKLAAHYNLPYTFRAAGTSLSGQAQSNSILINLTDAWRHHQILDLGNSIQLGPGVIGADANRYLAPYGRKLGPDPASINSCKIGGIAANNSSGMCCGVKHNSYHTMQSIRIILNDGSILDTSDTTNVREFTQRHAALVNGVQQLSQQIKADQPLTNLIQKKYRLKNTTGYGINALVDFDDPIDMIAHLMIGSEGTLGFISSITYQTVVEHKYKATALVLFEDITATCNAVTQLAKENVSAVELLDDRAMNSVSHLAGIPSFVKTAPTGSAALLIETSAANKALLQSQISTLADVVAQFKPIDQVAFTTDKTTSELLWLVRKQTFPAVGAVRETGTTVIIEDVAFPVEDLALGVVALQSLLNDFNYDEAIIFGHALDGNLHFVFTQNFEDKKEIQRYERFMEKVCNLVANDFGGSLKAEHGTGRNMAPFVKLEWGDKAYEVMEQVKQLFDPQNLINPGVIINQDELAHIKDLKTLPKADDIVDKCIECGFCETVCPSNGLTLTPRQRIASYRELAQTKTRAGVSTAELKQLEKGFEYLAIDTCAATGLCAQKCPVGINTGELVLKLRSKKNQKYRGVSRFIAKHFDNVEQAVRLSLQVTTLLHKGLGEKNLKSLSRILNKLSFGKFPLWHQAMPQVNRRSLNISTTKLADNIETKKVVYFPSCASRNLGLDSKATNSSLPAQTAEEALMSLLNKADVHVIVPNSTGLCCGMPFNSKGQFEQAQNKANELIELLLKSSNNGDIPIIFDTSPCKMQLEKSALQGLNIFEPFEYIEKYLVDALDFTPIQEPVMLHVTCSSQKMGLTSIMKQLASRCSDSVVVPEFVECCGFAGDKGFTTPELNANALKELKRQVPNNCSIGVSNSRTCEIGLSNHAGIEYQSIINLVDAVTQAKL